MRWPSLCCLLVLTACGAGPVTQKKLSDGSIQVSCELPMDDCLRRVQDQCERQRYRILEGTSETRLRDVPPYEQEYHSSRLHLICTSGPPALISLDSPAAKPASNATAPICIKGETRACVGPAACHGGQACLADGTGFGACDCGPVTPPGSAGSPSVPPAAGGPSTTDPPSPSPGAVPGSGTPAP